MRIALHDSRSIQTTTTQQPTHMSPLQLESLYIAVFLGPAIDKPHWALYHHTSETKGWKYHIKGAGNNSWIAEHATVGAILRTVLLTGLVRIAHIDLALEAAVREHIYTIPHDTEGTTCRVWLLKAVSGMIEKGWVACDDIRALEKEVFAFAAEQFEDTMNNVQPRPVIESKVCSFGSVCLPVGCATQATLSDHLVFMKYATAANRNRRTLLPFVPSSMRAKLRVYQIHV